MCSITDKHIILKNLNILESDLKDLHAVIISKDTITYNKVLNQLTDILINSWDDACKKAINNAIEYVVNKGEANFTESDIKDIDAMMQKALGTDLAGAVESSVMDLNQMALKLGLKEVLKSLKLKLGFDVSDQEAAAILGKHNMFFIGDYYNSQLSGNIDKVIRDYFTSNKTLEEVANDFEIQFGKIIDKGTDYFKLLADHTVNRTREIGRINGYEKAGIIKYEIKATMNERTCELCIEMNGKIFEVQQAIDLRDKILGMDDPRDIKNIAPWRSPDEIKGLSVADLPGGMEFPPFHGYCYCLTVAYFE